MSSRARAALPWSWPAGRPLAADARLLAWAAVAALIGAVGWTVLAYSTSLKVAIAAPIALAVVVLVVWRPISGVYLGLLCVPLERVGFASGGAQVTPSKALFVLVGLVAVGRLLVDPAARTVHAAHYWFAGLVLVMAVGISVTQDPTTTVKIVIQWAAYLAMSMLVASASLKQLHRIAGCLAFSGAVLGVIAAVTSKPQEVISGGQAATNRAQAGFEHPAVLAFFLVLALAPGLAFAFKSRPSLRGPLLIGAGMTIAGILLSLTRSAILGAAASLAIMLWWRPFRRLALVLLTAILLFGIFNLQAIQRSPEVRVIGQRLQSVTDTTATQDNERVLIWSKTPAIIADHPFIGIGAGDFVNVSPSYGIVDAGGLPFIHAHDVLLTIAAESGLIGLALFVAFLISLAVPAVRVIASRRQAPAFPYAISFAAALAGLMVCGVADHPPATLVIMAVFMLEVGAFIAAQRLVDAAPPAADAAGGPAS